jgi:hypothetical protein
LEEDDIKKMHVTPPEKLTDEELLLTTFCVDDLQRKNSSSWDKHHPSTHQVPLLLETIQVQDFSGPMTHDLSDTRQHW